MGDFWQAARGKTAKRSLLKRQETRRAAQGSHVPFAQDAFATINFFFGRICVSTGRRDGLHRAARSNVAGLLQLPTIAFSTY
jgi:hypothetical protein